MTKTKTKPKDKPPMQILKTATCKTLSGKSTLTYQIGCTPDSVVHLRISKNSGGGFFSEEILSFDAIYEALKKLPSDTPISSYYLAHLFKGKSVNTPSFLLSVLKHLKIIRALPNNKRHHELLDPRPFLDQVSKLMSSPEKTKAPAKRPTKKTVTKKATVKKAAIKKRAISRRKKASTV